MLKCTGLNVEFALATELPQEYIALMILNFILRKTICVGNFFRQKTLEQNMLRTRLTVLTLLLALLLPTTGWSKVAHDFDSNRARLLGHMIQQQLSHNHYSHKPTDDKLSHAAFDLYLKQLDFQKRFLLLEDVAQLKGYQDLIDDSIRRGRLDLPETGRNLLNQRIDQVEKMFEELLQQKIDYNKPEVIQTDPEKLNFAANLKELRERWRKLLKFQILSRYINLREDEIGVDEAGVLSR